jgi:hypothetical protein
MVGVYEDVLSVLLMLHRRRNRWELITFRHVIFRGTVVASVCKNRSPGVAAALMLLLV